METYLNDIEFLKQLDCENYREQYVRIVALDFATENSIASIEGKCTSGSCNLSGTSNMRRTASCTLLVDSHSSPSYADVTNMENLISMNKKVRLEVGLKNFTNKYPTYDTIWFPLGTFIVKTASVAKNSSGISVSVTLNDKCSLLNGDVGGIIPIATVFSELDSYSNDGTHVTEKILIRDIIKNLVVDYGGESPDKVIITDIDDYIVKVMKWNGKTSAFLYDGTYIDSGMDADQTNKVLLKQTQQDADSNASVPAGATQFLKGQDIGYTIEPFVYPGTLECNAGDTIASMLDKIRNTLGNFEWFYDAKGMFHFQEIKNYLNTSKATSILETESSDFMSVANLSKAAYVFDEKNKHLISSISHSPQYQNIKNDFVIWGTKKSATGVDKPIQYHVVIDSKPTVTTFSSNRLAIVYTDYKNLQSIIPLHPSQGVDWVYLANASSYPITEDKFYIRSTDNKVFAYSEKTKQFQELSGYKICYLTLDADDWRGELYLQSLYSTDKTVKNNAYLAELKSEWPKIWEVYDTNASTGSFPYYKGRLKSTSQLPLSDYEYWIDFLEGDKFTPFSVSKIGRRTKVVTENDINCIFATSIPNYIFAETSQGSAAKIHEVADRLGRSVIQVNSNVYSQLVLGGTQNAAYDRARELVIASLSYAESVALSVVPIYHIEPNIRISIKDEDIGIAGDYMIKSISLPLTANGSSNISATRFENREEEYTTRSQTTSSTPSDPGSRFIVLDDPNSKLDNGKLA